MRGYSYMLQTRVCLLCKCAWWTWFAAAEVSWNVLGQVPDSKHVSCCRYGRKMKSQAVAFVSVQQYKMWNVNNQRSARPREMRRQTKCVDKQVYHKLLMERQTRQLVNLLSLVMWLSITTKDLKSPLEWNQLSIKSLTNDNISWECS